MNRIAMILALSVTSLVAAAAAACPPPPCGPTYYGYAPSYYYPSQRYAYDFDEEDEPQFVTRSTARFPSGPTVARRSGVPATRTNFGPSFGREPSIQPNEIGPRVATGDRGRNVLPDTFEPSRPPAGRFQLSPTIRPTPSSPEVAVGPSGGNPSIFRQAPSNNNGPSGGGLAIRPNAGSPSASVNPSGKVVQGIVPQAPAKGKGQPPTRNNRR